MLISCIQKGDVITIRRSAGNGWLEGERDGKIGLFPSSYIKLVNILVKGIILHYFYLCDINYEYLILMVIVTDTGGTFQH